VAAGTAPGHYFGVLAATGRTVVGLDCSADQLHRSAQIRLTGWHQPAPWWGEYVRRRVGMRQHSLADVLWVTGRSR